MPPATYVVFRRAGRCGGRFAAPRVCKGGGTPRPYGEMLAAAQYDAVDALVFSLDHALVLPLVRLVLAQHLPDGLQHAPGYGHPGLHGAPAVGDPGVYFCHVGIVPRSYECRLHHGRAQPGRAAFVDAAVPDGLAAVAVAGRQAGPCPKSSDL